MAEKEVWEYDKRDRGMLFTNNRKSSARAPDYRGEITFDLKFINELIANEGVIKIAAWVKKQKRGTMIALKVSRWKKGDPVTEADKYDDYEVLE